MVLKSQLFLEREYKISIASSTSFSQGCLGIPMLNPTNFVPEKLISFSDIPANNSSISKKGKDYYDAGIHFYIDDYKFDRIWHSLDKYILRLKNYSCVLTPDFSLYSDMSI